MLSCDESKKRVELSLKLSSVAPPKWNWSNLTKGEVVEGHVRRVETYGVFVDLGGIDGLIHITDLSWGRISHPEEVVSLDEVINVVILDFDEAKSRIQLGLKQLGAHPWDSLKEDISGKSANQVRIILSSILSEYKPAYTC